MAGYDEKKSPEENLAVAVFEVATALRDLGKADAVTGMGAVELVAREIRDGFNQLAEAIQYHAQYGNQPDE